MTERKNLFSATGIPSLFLIFAVLMLVILSLLGYGTSRQDLRTSSLALEQTTSYYTVCTQASDFYTDTVPVLSQLKQQSQNVGEYQKLLTDYFSEKEDVIWDAATSKLYFVKSFSQVQSLLVVISIAKFWESSENPAEILTWNTIVTADWDPDTIQAVYKGE